MSFLNDLRQAFGRSEDTESNNAQKESAKSVTEL